MTLSECLIKPDSRGPRACGKSKSYHFVRGRSCCLSKDQAVSEAISAVHICEG